MEQLKSIKASNFQEIPLLKKRIYLEERMAERTRYTFSIITGPIVKNLKSNGDQDRITSKLNTILITHICSNIRITDVVSLLDDDTIILLLPDTSYEQAKQFINRINSKLAASEELGGFAVPIFHPLNVRILTYPFVLHKSDNGNCQKNQQISDIEALFAGLMTGKDNFRFDLIQVANSNQIQKNVNSLMMSRVKSYKYKGMAAIIQKSQWAIKRLIDILGSILGFILTSPIIVITVLLIKLTSRGPVLFKQQRVGYKGKLFNIYKFRSMRQSASEKIHQDYIKDLLSDELTSNKTVENVENYQSQIDHRITGIGKILRKTSIDELPQLLNIFLGDMSLVGPRPHPVYEVEFYKNWYYRRLLAKPGLTGLSKIKVRCTPENYDGAMRYDVRYVDQWSIIKDLKILVQTIPSVLLGNGAY